MARHVRVPLEGLRAGEQRLSGAPARYLTRVLRLREGAVVTAFDPSARLEAEMTLLGVDGDGARVRFAEPVPARLVGLTGVTLIQCAGKGDKVDEVVRAATALGASAIVIAQSERTVARGAPSQERRERLHAIALDAARQSGRGDLPELRGPLPLADVLSEWTRAPSLKLCLEPAASLSFGRALAERGARDLALLVGPEGGFASDERAAAEAAGFVLVRLGSLVLRTELAGAAAVAAVLAAE